MVFVWCFIELLLPLQVSLIHMQLWSNVQQLIVLFWPLATGLSRAFRRSTTKVQVEAQCCPPSFSSTYIPHSEVPLKHMYALTHVYQLLNYKQSPFGCMVLRIHMSEMRFADKGGGPFSPWKQAQSIGSGIFRVPGTRRWCRRGNGILNWVQTPGLRNICSSGRE